MSNVTEDDIHPGSSLTVAGVKYSVKSLTFDRNNILRGATLVNPDTGSPPSSKSLRSEGRSSRSASGCP